MISGKNIKPQRLLLHSQQVFDTWYRPTYVVILLCKGTKRPVTYYSSRNVSKAFQNFFGVLRTLSTTQPIFNLQSVASQRVAVVFINKTSQMHVGSSKLSVVHAPRSQNKHPQYPAISSSSIVQLTVSFRRPQTQRPCAPAHIKTLCFGYQYFRNVIKLILKYIKHTVID